MEYNFEFNGFTVLFQDIYFNGTSLYVKQTKVTRNDKTVEFSKLFISKDGSVKSSDDKLIQLFGANE